MSRKRGSGPRRSSPPEEGNGTELEVQSDGLQSTGDISFRPAPSPPCKFSKWGAGGVQVPSQLVKGNGVGRGLGTPLSPSPSFKASGGLTHDEGCVLMPWVKGADAPPFLQQGIPVFIRHQAEMLQILAGTSKNEDSGGLFCRVQGSHPGSRRSPPTFLPLQGSIPAHALQDDQEHLTGLRRRKWQLCPPRHGKAKHNF